MSEHFIPSSSVDSYTRPMDPDMPLLEPDESGNTNQPSSTSTVIKLVSNDPKALAPVQPQVASSNKGQLVDKLFPTRQLKHLEFYQALLSEYIGTFLLTLVCTSTGLPIATKRVPDLHGALASGFIVATIIVGFGHTSGAHINPAVTVSFLVTNEIDIFRGLFYIGMQLLGAVSGSYLLRSIAPDYAQSYLGMTTITSGVTLSQAFMIEFIITFLLCYTVQAICDRNRDDIGGSKALAVGLAVTIGCLFGGPYTGGSMNPARSFGPATVMNSWENHWIYWFGPLTGAIVAALIYTRVLKRPPSPTVVRANNRLRLDAHENNHI